MTKKFAEGDYETVVKITLDTLKLGYPYRNIMLYAGLAYKQLGRIDDAKKAIEKELELFPNSYRAKLELGRL